MTRDNGEALESALSAFKEAGLKEGEVLLEDYSVFSVAVAEEVIESLETKEVRGAGLRVFDRGRVAFSYTSDVTPAGFREAVGIARALLDLSDPDEANRLPEADAVSAPEPETFDPSMERVDQNEKISMARRAEDAARAADKRVTRIRQSRYSEAIGRIDVINTGGLRRGWPFSRAYTSVQLTAEQGGEQQSGYYSDFAIRFSGLDPAAVGREAARHATQKLGAARTATRRANLVLDPHIASQLLGAISPAFHADNVLKGKSLLASRVGQDVARSSVTLVDDGRLQGADQSAPYDTEGIATRRTILIGDGALKGFLHSNYTSLRMGAAPTGNASRSSFMSSPRIAPSNLYLEPTGAGREALLAQAEDGLYITDVMGLHTVDPVSGDFSLGASGLALKGGEAGTPVDRIGIAGNILDLLRSIAGVATDLRFMPGGGAGSTTLLADISVSGT